MNVRQVALNKVSYQNELTSFYGLTLRVKGIYYTKVGLFLSLVFGFLFSFPGYWDGRIGFVGFIVFLVAITLYNFLAWLVCGYVHQSNFIAFSSPRFAPYQKSIIFLLICELGLGFVIATVYLLLFYREAYIKDPATAVFFSRSTIHGAINLKIFFIIIHGVILFVYQNITIGKEREKIKLEKEQVTSENIRSQFESLRQQLNPHFLFNSLNSLKSLVSTQPKQAEEFIVQLANVYRYLLKHRSHDLVTLEDETSFLNSYVFLLKIRFEDNLKIDKICEHEHLRKLLVPLTLQLLIENAVKHNIISSAIPLSIKISVNENSLLVSNGIHLRQEVEGSSNFGLYNLKRQYKFFTDEEIVIQKNQTDFSVKIPLLANAKFKEGTRTE